MASHNHNYQLLFSIILLTTAFGLVYHAHIYLPEPLNSSSLSFSEARARTHLEFISGLGVRTVGSRANEDTTPEYIIGFANKTARTAHKGTKVEVLIQRPTGSFYLDFLDGMTSLYTNITNILVRVSAADGGVAAVEHALLISAHYDSIIGSPGASDDAAAIAVMLDVLHLMAHKKHVGHAVIFNFNGAEENVLQASHGFITQHPWTRSIRAFINMEASGSGGQEILFQAGPKNPWLELFGTEVIPSDTDFRIYRDYGDIPGLDFAWIANGYLYHTSLDTADRIPPGTLQHTGDNILSVVCRIIQSEKLANPGEDADGDVVYFDVLRAFTVVYGREAEFVLNFIGLSAAAIFLYTRSFHTHCFHHNLSRGVKIQVSGIFYALVFAGMTGVALKASGGEYVWFANPVSEALKDESAHIDLEKDDEVYQQENCGHVFASNALKEEIIREACLGQAERDRFAGALAIWSFILAITTTLRVRSGYFALAWTFPPTITRIIMERNTSCSILLFQGLTALGQLPGLILTLSTIVPVVELFVPLLGRLGDEIPADVAIGILYSFSTLCASLFISSIAACSFQTKYISLVNKFTIRAGIVFFLLCFSTGQVLNKYSANLDRPKRLFMQHVEREVTFINGEVENDIGLWISSMDATKLRPFLSQDNPETYSIFSQATEMRFQMLPGFSSKDYENIPAGLGQPWYLPVRHLLGTTYWLSLSNHEKLPAKGKKTALHLLSEETVGHKRRANFEVFGPSHLSIYLSPCPGAADLTNWSFVQPVPPGYDGEHFVYLASGSRGRNSWRFWLEFELSSTGPPDACKTSRGDITYVIAVAGQYLTETSPSLENLVTKISKECPWAVPTRWNIIAQLSTLCG
eukprot:UC4_evm9s1188